MEEGTFHSSRHFRCSLNEGCERARLQMSRLSLGDHNLNELVATGQTGCGVFNQIFSMRGQEALFLPE
jgi:hypothetical protein